MNLVSSVIYLILMLLPVAVPSSLSQTQLQQLSAVLRLGLQETKEVVVLTVGERQVLRSMGMSKTDMEEVEELARSVVTEEHSTMGELLADLSDEELTMLTEGSDEDIVEACTALKLSKQGQPNSATRVKREATPRLHISATIDHRFSLGLDWPRREGLNNRENSREINAQDHYSREHYHNEQYPQNKGYYHGGRYGGEDDYYRVGYRRQGQNRRYRRHLDYFLNRKMNTPTEVVSLSVNLGGEEHSVGGSVEGRLDSVVK